MNYAANIISLMDEVGIKRSLLMPPPGSGDSSFAAEYDYSFLNDAVNSYTDRLGLVGGGKILYSEIHSAVLNGTSTKTAVLDEFDAKAQAIADAGVAGFGEMAILHLSYRPSHPFIETPGDHPLFLRLADVAARNGLPIDIHLELVTQNMEHTKPAT